MVNQNEFECDVCKRIFKAKATLLKHAKSHRKGKFLITKPMKKSKAVKKKTFPCTQCNKTFLSRLELDSHNKILHMKDEIVGDAKKKRSTWKRRKHFGALHTCTVCNKTFPTNFKLVRHGYTHMAIKPFPCDICGRRFSRKDHLQVHYRIHTGEKTCYCAECGQGFNNTTALHRHIDRLHSVDRRTVQCPECGLEFAFKAQLKRHYDFAHKTCFTCEFCGNISSSESALFRHLRKHVLSEPFVCLMCSSTFSTTELMKEHECYPEEEETCKVVVRVALASLLDLDIELDQLDQSDALKLQRKFDNRGRKPGQKPIFSFANSTRNEVDFFDLEASERSNHNYSCKFCEKWFYTEAGKMAHEAIHIDEFALFRHLRKHVPSEPFVCLMCSSTFSTTESMKEHKCYPEEEEPCKVVVRVASASSLDLHTEIDPLDQCDAQRLQQKYDNHESKPGQKSIFSSYANGTRNGVDFFDSEANE